MKILIVNYSQVMKRLYKNPLIENKIKDEEFLEGEDGEKALEIAKKENIDIFLVDWSVPKLDGFEFVKQIRSMD